MIQTFTTPNELEAAVAAGFRFIPEHGPAGFVCGRCKETKPLNTEGTGGTGYATAGAAFRCYDCCGEEDSAEMVRTGRAMLYLSKIGPGNEGEVCNWPGTLKFWARVKRGRHNIAGSRYDAWFTGPGGEPWHGVAYGGGMLRCRRMKR
jgi:hypothetical protein